MTEPRLYFCDACGKNIGKREPPATVKCTRCGHMNMIKASGKVGV